MKNLQPDVLFLSHGGGPLPLLGDDGHVEMLTTLNHIAANIRKPSAILVISAHWEETIPTITAGSAPSLIYDYYGFPKESYEITYPCPGEPELANEVFQALGNDGIAARLDKEGGLDHGVFVPLKIMYPDADIPCVQLSLVKGLDPAEHIKIGSALASIQYENLLVIGSGFSFHNIRAFFAPITHDSQSMNDAFDNWLIDTCVNPDIGEDARTERFVNWEDAPYARYCHPREEHLLPLMVCYGMTHKACKEYFQLHIMNKKTSMYLW